jgi:predicted solute-binding protein
MCVNEATLDYGERGRRGVALFYRRAHEASLILHIARPLFVRG